MPSINSHFTFEETEARTVTSVMKLQVSGPTAPEDLGLRDNWEKAEDPAPFNERERGR